MSAAVRIAVIGLGFMGSKWAQAVAQHADARLMLVCDIDAHRARSAATKYGCRWSTETEVAAADPRVDAVVVATPDHLHEAPSVAALGAGHALAVEKPFAHEVAAAERIQRAAQQSGAPVLAGHVLRFDPRYAAIRRAIDDGLIGAVQAVRSERIGLVNDQDVLGGRVSVPLYYGTHEMDLARWYAGPIARVAASRSAGVLRSRGYDIDDLYSAQLTFTSGAHGTAMLGWLLPSGGRPLAGFSVIGEQGYLQVDQTTTGLSAYDGGGPVALDTWYSPQVHDRAGGALAHEVDHFVQVAHGRVLPLCSAEDGAAAVRASLTLDRAAEQGQFITIEEDH